MQITQATEYAVRCVLHLALSPAAQVVPRREISRARDIPGPFLAKIAQQMARAGILRIHQGARGGYELLIPARWLTLLQVVEAAEGVIALNTCVAHKQICSRTQSCAAHRVWAKAQRELRATLASVTFAKLATSEGAPARKQIKKGK